MSKITESQLKQMARNQLERQQQDGNDAVAEWVSIISNSKPEETLQAIEEDLRNQYEVIED